MLLSFRGMELEPVSQSIVWPEAGPAPAVATADWLPDRAGLIDLLDVGSASDGAVIAIDPVGRDLEADVPLAEVMAAWCLIEARATGRDHCGWRRLTDEPMVGPVAEVAYRSDLGWTDWVALVATALGVDPAFRLTADQTVRIGTDLAQHAAAPAAGTLVLSFSGRPQGGTHLVVRFDPTRIEAAAIEALLDTVQHLLSRAGGRQGEAIGRWELLSPPARAALVGLGRGPACPIPDEADLISAFEAQVRARPQAEALRVPGAESITYAGLNARSEALALRLQACGLRPGALVALALPRGVDAVVAMLATLRSGAAYLPMDARWPLAEQLRVLDEVGVSLVVGLAVVRQAAEDEGDGREGGDFAGLAPALTKAGPALLRIDAPDRDPRSAEHAPQAAVGADAGAGAGGPAPRGKIAPAYLMFSSGSTGVPKGIVVPQAAVLRLVAPSDWIALGPGARMLLAAPLGFDASTLEIWGPLLNGGCCVIHPEGVITGVGLEATLRGEGVTVAWLTASLFNALVDERPQALATLPHLITGGEALSVAHVRRAQHLLPELRLSNGYGPTENTTFTTTAAIERPLGPVDRVPIGRPITNTECRVLGPDRGWLPRGLVGELHVSGEGLALGYAGRPDLDADRFAPDAGGRARWYRTGDLVRWRADGRLDYIGRADSQVKVRGFRIELAAIEAALARLEGVTACAVQALRDAQRGTRLIAHVVGPGANEPARLRRELAHTLPDYMLPERFVSIERLPVTANGKLDRARLPGMPVSGSKPAAATAAEGRRGPAADRSSVPGPQTAARGGGAADAVARDLIATVLAALLDRADIGLHENFFELGGNSLLVMRALERINQAIAEADSERPMAARRQPLKAAAFYEDPTVAGLARALDGRADAAPAPDFSASPSPASPSPAAPDPASPDPAPGSTGRPAGATGDEPIAIVGMALRLPGADSVEDFWANLLEGRDSIERFTATSLDPGVPVALREDPAYVAARGVIRDVAGFDARFFGIGPREAALMDPQQRVFMEISWECLERAGERPEGRIGVFGGMNNATYFQRHLSAHSEAVEQLGEFAVMLANEKDYLALRTANRLNLQGPAISLNTACSTSLVAICQAVDSLRAGHCDMALAGGVSITCPPSSGYLYEEGSMLSPDGHTRSFDARGAGTVFSDGAAVVLLKPLSRALADGNTVHAVIRGVALNNDGLAKASFTAPSVVGQRRVIEDALQRSGLRAADVSYVEAHGTATPLGDPVEVEGLRQAFAATQAPGQRVGLGSVKSNIGHTVMAAGAAGVIKTALALQQEQLPATVHFERSNPNIDFAATPFQVVDRLSAWPRTARARRAGVSSFGVGGTNAHLILEEAPVEALPAVGGMPAPGSTHLLRLSARSAPALARMAARLAEALEADGAPALGDVAHTLAVGRRDFEHRLVVAAVDHAGAAAALRDERGARPLVRAGAVLKTDTRPSLLWMFPGQGAQYLGMGRARHQSDPHFRRALDEAISAVDEARGGSLGLAGVMWGTDVDALNQTQWTQPALFAIELALGRAWEAAGSAPTALIGHSIGEFAAAVLAGVMSLADAARLVEARGRLMQALPAGSMLAVRAGVEALRELPEGLVVAAVNGPQAVVVAGPTPAVQAFADTLRERNVAHRLLATSHAFHSPMMDGALEAFGTVVRSVSLRPAQRPIYSTRLGRLAEAQTWCEPDYWIGHLREPVQFSSALQAFWHDHPVSVALELGPRGHLAGMARQHAASGRVLPTVITSLGEAVDEEDAGFELARGRLWCAGLPMPGSVATSARRVVLPTYPFERQRYWFDMNPARPANSAIPAVLAAVAAAGATGPDESAGIPAGEATMKSSLTDLRRERLMVELRQMFEDTSGLSLEAADPDASFVELGLDSLMLTQIALQLKRRYPVPVSFRQLMESQRSFAELSAHLDAQLPPEVAVAPATGVAIAGPLPAPVLSPMAGSTAGSMAVPLVMPTVAADPAGGPSPWVQQVILQQMQILSQQLALLAGGLPAGGPGPVQPASQAVPAAATTQPGVAVGAVASGAVVAPDATNTEPAQIASPPAGTAGPVAANPAAAETEGVRGGKAVYDVKKAFGAIARIRRQDSELSELQKTRLEALIRRYVERTARSKAYTETHRAHLADPRVVNGFSPRLKEMIYQIVVERSKGAHLWDIDGNDYVDVLNGFGMSLFGWQPDFVLDAVRAQLDAGYEIGPQHPYSGEVADLICELTGFDRAALCNTGSEAVMAAVRMARTVTGRDMVVLFSGSYHGTFDEVVVRAGRQARGLPAAPGIMPGMFGDVRVLDYGTPESLAFIREHAADLAAVLVEPVQSRRPDFRPRDFLAEVREITRAAGTCLIFDEVITGFRSHPGGVQHLFGIQADLATYGKVIGGGYPIGVVAGRREFMDALDGGGWRYGDDSVPTVGVTYFAGTFVRHPLALAACRAVLLHLKAQGPALQAELNLQTACLADELNAICRETGAPIEIRSFSSLWRIVMLEDHPMQDLLFAMMRTRGIHILDNFPCFLTTAHGPADVAKIVSAFRESLAELQAAGFVPGRAPVAATVLDADQPPVAGARLGRGPDGRPAWFVPDPDHAGRYRRLNA